MDNKKRIYLASPHMSEEGYEMDYIREAFETNWIAPVGNNLDQFERALIDYVGVESGVALMSGTAALDMALKAAGVGEGDIVLCQSLTFSASANPIIYNRAIPVFIDSDLETWNLSPLALEEALKKYPEAKALIVVHLYGLSAEMDKIVELCKNYDVVLIEDAAESLGTKYKGKMTGSFGDYGIFSFNGNKIITTSGGGMLVSNNKERIDKVKFWSTQARDASAHYQHSEIGYNYRMSNIIAGIGRGQMRVLDKRIEKKKYIFDYYKRELSGLEGLSFMPVSEATEPNYWLSAIQLEGPIVPSQVIKALEEENIEARFVWKPMHLQPVFKDYDYIGKDNAERIFDKGLVLPSDTKMEDTDLERIVSVIRGLWK